MNLSFLLPVQSGVPVLMYHCVWPGRSDSLTIDPEVLATQWHYLQQEGYRTLSMQAFLECQQRGQFPPKSLLITFDDGYRNNLTYVYPLLQQLGWQATFFIIGETLQQDPPKTGNPVLDKMSLAELKTLDPAVVQLGIHGYAHKHFGEHALRTIREEIGLAVAAFEASGLDFCKVFAYPYGARPKNKQTLRAMYACLEDYGITAAFRIGNSVCRFPVKAPYEIRRIDIRGTDSLREFAQKLKKGKLHPF
jgi:peptidoglycan/xylan/chitin deacetylase (PgdA/CDA1 family)